MNWISPHAIELHANGDCWTGCPICTLEGQVEADS